MRGFFLAAAGALVLLAGPVSAEEAPPGGQPRCLAWPIAVEATKMHNPDAALVKVMDGGLANDFIAVVNALPPVSSFTGDHVALFFKESADRFLVVIGENECAKHMVELPAAVLAEMVGRPT